MPAPFGTLGKGTTIGYASSQGGPFTAFVKIRGRAPIKPPATKVGKAETTSFDDTSEQYIPGWISASDASFVFLYQNSSTSVAFPQLGTVQWFQVTLPDTHTWTFQGFISEYDPEVPMKEEVYESLKITVTGKPIYA